MEIPRSESTLEAGVVVSILMVVVLIGEAAVYLARPVVAVAVYCGLVFGAAILPFRASTNVAVFQAFALVGVFRIVDLGFPPAFDDPLLRVLVVYLPAAIAVLIVLFRSTSVDLGVNPRALLFLPLVILLGGGMAVAEYALLSPEWIEVDSTTTRIVAIVLVLGLLVAITEELLFRGLLQGAVRAELGPWPGRIVSSLVFGALHSVYLVGPEIGLGVAFGFVYAILYDYFEDITTVIVLHAAVNTLLFVVLPLWREQLPAWLL